MQKDKAISIFGLGYVGCVSMGCLAQQGHNVIGVDISEYKVELVNNGKATIIENKIGDIIQKNHQQGKICATIDPVEAVKRTDISIVCVGTPSDGNGHVNLDYIFNTASEIGEALKEKDSFHTVVIRSTVVPGTNEKYAAIVEEVSGKKAGVDFAMVSNPEFLREGSAVDDYFNPPYTIIGSDSEKAVSTIKELYKNIEAPIYTVDIKVAEMIKYVNNSFHALKISFANEVGNICKSLDIDSHELMSLFCKDDQLNISSAYLRPGFAYGGSCLPKDLRGLNALANDNYLDVPVLDSVSNSNEVQKDHAFELVNQFDTKKVGLVGLSFKEGTDDLRNSPAVDLAEKMLGKGYDLKIYDPNVQVSRLIGQNKSYIERHIPHLAELLVDELGVVIENSDLVILNQSKSDIEDYSSCLEEKILVDFVRADHLENKVKDYEGISW